jgi:ribosomal protein S6
MKKYELFLILPGTLDEKESEEKMGEALAVINEFGSESNVKSMGKNRLAYPINNVRYGYFYTIVFSSEAQNIKVIEEKLKLFRGLLRAVLSNFNKAIEGAENSRFFSNEDKIDFQEDAKEEKHFVPTDNAIEISFALEESKKSDKQTEEVDEEMPAQKIVSVEEKEQPKELDLKEIDKRLDEILSDDNINI